MVWAGSGRAANSRVGVWTGNLRTVCHATLPLQHARQLLWRKIWRHFLAFWDHSLAAQSAFRPLQETLTAMPACFLFLVSCFIPWGKRPLCCLFVHDILLWAISFNTQYNVFNYLHVKDLTKELQFMFTRTTASKRLLRDLDLQIQRPGFDSQRYQIFWEVVGLERGPLSLVSAIEELLERKSSG
jgi:hypothetical protein